MFFEFLIFQFLSCQVAHGVPHRKETDGNDRDEDEKNVGGVYADGVGIDDVAAFAVTEADEPEGLLNPAKEKPEGDADDGTDEAYHAAFYHEDATNLMLVGTQVSEGDGVLLLVDDEHGEGADDVEAGDEENEGEEDVGDEFLNLHDLESVFLLLIAVKHLVTGTELVLETVLDTLEVGAWLEAHLDGGNLTCALEESAGERKVGDDVL